MLKNHKGGVGEIRILSDGGMRKIHEQALHILETTGIAVQSETALKLLADAGCGVDFEESAVTIPSNLVAQCLEKVPQEVTFAGRNPERDRVLQPGGAMYTRYGGGMTHVHDVRSGEIREALLDDVGDFARLIDGLNYIDFIAPIYPSNIAPQTMEMEVLARLFRNTDKHISVRALDRGNFSYLIEMAEIVAGGRAQLKERPIISILEASITPLQLPEVFIDALFIGGEYGIPVEICSTPIVGATGPATLAGSLLLATAELLACVVISQIANPGAPLIWAPRFAVMDMSTGMAGMFVEATLVNAAAAQQATEFYHLVSDLHGPATNAILPDGLSVFEEFLAAFVTGMAGRPTILCGGALEIGLTASHIETVITNEIFSAGARIIEGFEVNDETLGLDAINRVGIGGNFLQDDHTLKHLRDEDHRSLFVKPITRDSWIAGGSKGMNDIAKEKALAILAKHQPAPLDEGVAGKLQQLIKDAEKAFGLV